MIEEYYKKKMRMRTRMRMIMKMENENKVINKQKKKFFLMSCQINI